MRISDWSSDVCSSDLGVEGLTFYGPIAKMPADVPAADKARLTESYRAAIAMKIQPALKRLRDFLHAEYLPKARIGFGLSQIPGGAAYYAYLVERQTTYEMHPEEIPRKSEANGLGKKGVRT